MSPNSRAADGLALSGGTVVVTGGGGLLGRSLALRCAARGANVIVADVNFTAAEVAAAEVSALPGVTGLAVATDVTDRVSMDELAEVAYETFGRVDLLCNNAGFAIVKPVFDLTAEDWQAVLSVHLNGVLNGIHAFMPRLVAAQRRGHIVNVASMSGVGRADLRSGNAPYVTAKHAIVGLTEAMQPALAEYNVGMSVLCPGFTRADPDTVTSFPLPSAEWYRENLLSPDEVADETIAGVLEDRLHIFPHRAGRQEVVDRHELLMRGFDQAELTSPRLNSRPNERRSTES